jgi:hypothetical protein
MLGAFKEQEQEPPQVSSAFSTPQTRSCVLRVFVREAETLRHPKRHVARASFRGEAQESDQGEERK